MTETKLDEKGTMEPSGPACATAQSTTAVDQFALSRGDKTVPSGRSAKEPAGSFRNRSRQLFGLFGLFVVALAVRLWFNFATTHVNCANACDASEYLRNAAALMGLEKLPLSFWQDALVVLLGNHTQEAAVRAQLSTLSEMHQSAPIFPLFLLSSFAIAGSTFDTVNCVAPVAAQSVLSALTCVLIALIATRAWNGKAGFTAGILAAFYPGFIVNSGRLYTETFSAFLICALFWLVMRAFSFKERSAALLPTLVIAGITAASLQLTRSIMLSACLALVPLSYWVFRKHRPLGKVAALVAGFALVVVPWFALQKLTFGKVNLVVDRAGHYNFFVGNNIEADGLLTYPYQDCTNVDARSYPSIISESFKKNPSGWLALTIDKAIRMFKLPWNDFRTSIGPFTHSSQSLVHQLMLVFAALGLVLGLTTNVGTAAPDRKQLACRSAIALTLMLHLIYVLFITVPRYNLTAMPFVLMLSGAGLVSLMSLSRERSTRSAALATAACALILFLCARTNLVAILSAMPASAFAWLVASCTIKFLFMAAFLYCLWRLLPSLSGDRQLAKGMTFLLSIIVIFSVCLPLRAHGRWYEWQCTLDAPGDSVSQSICLPRNFEQLRDRPWFLMIDAQGDLDGMDILVNGQRPSGAAAPSLSLVPEVKEALADGKMLRRECEYIFSCMTHGAGISNRDLRQWFLIPVTPSMLMGTGGAGDSKTVDVTITRANASKTRLFGAYDLGEGRNAVPSTTLYSWEKTFYGVENDGGLTDTRYDTDVKELIYSQAKYSPSTGRASVSDLSSEAGVQTGAYNIRLLVGPESPSDSTGTVAAEMKPATGAALQTLSLAGQHGVEQIPLAVPGYSKPSVWLITASGEHKGAESDGTVGVNVAADFDTADKGTLSYHSPWTRKLQVKQVWQPFEFTLPLEPGYFPGQLRNVELNLHKRGSAAVELRNLSVKITPLASNPLLPGHAIY